MGRPASAQVPAFAPDWVTVVTVWFPAAMVTDTPTAGLPSDTVVTSPDNVPAAFDSVSRTLVSC